MSPIITLTTDFGIRDAYVGSMKGAILSVNRDVSLVDISHDIEPQNIGEAAFVVGSAWQYFPPGTIHIVVVDPGVGTSRQAVLVKAQGSYFVAPDNGVLTYVVKKAMEEAHFVIRGITTATATSLDIGEPVEAVTLTNKKFWRQHISSTFHGRDIFGPVSAYLSLGTPMSDFGEAIKSLCILPISGSQSLPDGTVTGTIIHIDRFGNVVTNIMAGELPKGDIAVQIGKHTVSGLSPTYSQGDGLLAALGSEGNLEIAYRSGSARDFINAKIGDEVKVRSIPVEPGNGKTAFGGQKGG
ncbi:MAG: SAM-dependent chlorinase/fluorinase [Chloroflexi bacterium]|nr:SAM-dependent chlorinase/fluorinase [Chloroflexota bacterium]